MGGAATDQGNAQGQQRDGTAAGQEQQQQWLTSGGFALDEASGYYYSSSFGLWYQPETSLYMDAQTGAW